MALRDLTDEYVYRIAPDGKSAHAALGLVAGGAYSAARVSSDGTCLSGDCQGSGLYRVNVRLTDLDHPETGCTCASMKHPCKHALGLLFLAVRSPEQFQPGGGPTAPGGESRASRRPAEGQLQGATVRKGAAAEDAPPADLEEALFQAILAEPEDDAPRLIYADWLEEHGGAGQQARAEFIRVQIALAHAPEGDPRRPAPKKREAALWAKHRTAWQNGLPPYLRKRHLPFQRGFLDELALRPAACCKHAEALFARQPVHRIRLSGELDPGEAGELVVLPYLTRIRSLIVEKPTFREVSRTLQILLSTPFFNGLTRLALREGGLSSREMAVLCESPVIPRLQELDLAGNEVGPKGAQLLAGAPFGALRGLSLAANPLGDVGARALAASPRLDGLVRLDLRGVPLGESARAALRERFQTRVLLD